MDTYLYDISIPAISSLQARLADQSDLMQLMSVVFDPKYAFLIYSPIAYLCDRQVGKRLILTTVIAEWLNQILKWLLHGERPYWYVHSSGHFDPQQVPIKQFPITCELGPGHPSGHSMVTAAVWYIILDALLHLAHSSAGQKTTAFSRAKLTVWTLYVILLASVAVSRVFLGCHFPHQCLAGAILGLILANRISRIQFKPIHFIGASLFLLLTAFGTFGLLQALGADPSWTIKLAMSHCVKRDYIHLDTAPFFSIMRYCGFALGCGLALAFPVGNYLKQLMPFNSEQVRESSNASKGYNDTIVSKATLGNSKNFSWFSVKILMALLMARLVDNLALFVTHSNLPLFYSSAFFAYTLFSYAFVNL